MAKAARKASAKKAATEKGKEKNAKPNKFTIDLGNLELTEKERRKLLEAVHKTVISKIKTSSVQVPEKAVPMKAAATMTGSATISATFRNTDPGVSKLTATHNGEEKTITQTGTINLVNVKKGEVIMVQGKSLGKADISIDREADPQSIKFEPGIIAFNFFILS